MGRVLMGGLTRMKTEMRRATSENKTTLAGHEGGWHGKKRRDSQIAIEGGGEEGDDEGDESDRAEELGGKEEIEEAFFLYLALVDVVKGEEDVADEDGCDDGEEDEGVVCLAELLGIGGGYEGGIGEEAVGGGRGGHGGVVGGWDGEGRCEDYGELGRGRRHGETRRRACRGT